MVVDDFIGEFHILDINNWANSLENVLHMLNFPVQVEYVCEWKSFLYEKSDCSRYFSTADRKILAECQEIAMFSMNGHFRKLKMISVLLTGNPYLRNEKAYDIYKLFRRVYGRHILFVVCFNQDIAFVGTVVNEWKKWEVIISDWFGERTDREILSRILEIDFSLFSSDSFGKLYEDYLWAIARPYVRYRESKIYLIYGCEDVEAYESLVVDWDGTMVPITKIDREETHRVNSAYYLDLYGDDYFLDELSTEDEILDILDEDDAEFEWTILEMELAKEDVMDEDDFEDEDEYDQGEEAEREDISRMNPEEMLKFIRGE